MEIKVVCYMIWFSEKYSASIGLHARVSSYEEKVARRKSSRS